MKVLIIDDDEFILELYERVFQLENHNVDFAQTGIQAYDKLAKMDPLPDVIILDLMMPEMDGFEFLKKIKDQDKFKKTPIIILSNLYSREDKEKGLKLGASTYLVKSEHDPKEIVTQAVALLNK